MFTNQNQGQITTVSSQNTALGEPSRSQVINERRFTDDLRGDRLSLINQATGFISLGLFGLLVTLTYVGRQEIEADAGQMLIAGLLLVGGSWLVALLQRLRKIDEAIWIYALYVNIALGVLLLTTHPLTLRTLPFVLPVFSFMLGLMLDRRGRFIIALMAIAVGLGAPALAVPDIASYQLLPHQTIVALLILFAALLADQITNELYAMTQSAIEAYRHERRTHDELFNKREALQRALRRSEVLAQQLIASNRALDQARQQAEAAKQSRGEFLSNMSHELRTPLNAIIGFSETMLRFPQMYDDTALPDPYVRDVNQIFSSGRQLMHVIDDILDLTRVDAGQLDIQLERVSLREIILGTLATAKGLVGPKPIRLESSLPDPLPDAWADEGRLRQVLLNLYSNAAKYTEEGFIKLTVTHDEARISFAVQDTGCGIAAEDHDRMFQEFQQAQSSRRDPRAGTGLGLAISRRLLELMNGTIRFESAPGKGSTFTFDVPLYVGQDTAAATPSDSQAASEPVRSAAS